LVIEDLDRAAMGDGYSFVLADVVFAIDHEDTLWRRHLRLDRRELGILCGRYREGMAES
jgi:hypothetical protein